MNLRDLRYLVAVAEHRHFGRAAESCYVSQPTLSAQIKKLEGFLRVQLIERTNRKVMLTPIGEDIAERARGVLAGADDIIETARSASDPLAGDLRLGLIPTVAPYLLPHLVPGLRETLPRVRPLLYEEQTSSCLDKLRRGELDAAVLAVPVDGTEGLMQLALYREPFLLAVPSTHPLGGEGMVQLEELAGEQVLLLEDGHCLRDQALDICKLVGAGEAREFRATSLETLRQMVASGIGMTLLPRLAAEVGGIANAKAVRLREFAEPKPSRQIALLWRKGSARESVMKAVAEIVRQLPAVQALSDRPWKEPKRMSG